MGSGLTWKVKGDHNGPPPGRTDSMPRRGDPASQLPLCGGSGAQFLVPIQGFFLGVVLRWVGYVGALAVDGEYQAAVA